MLRSHGWIFDENLSLQRVMQYKRVSSSKTLLRTIEKTHSMKAALHGKVIGPSVGTRQPKLLRHSKQLFEDFATQIRQGHHKPFLVGSIYNKVTLLSWPAAYISALAVAMGCFSSH